MDKGKGVATLHRDYGEFSLKWKRCRDVSDGQDAMHKAGETYLPKLKDEEQSDYAARVKRSNFFNGTWRTLSILNGMMFRKQPKTDVPAGIVSYLKDIDLAGSSIDTFGRTIGLEVLECGRVGILVDHPSQVIGENGSPQISRADGKVVDITAHAAEQLGIRPLIQFYRAETIINWKHSRIRNRHQLSMVVLEECETEPDGEFGEKEVKQYRVLDLDAGGHYRVRLFRRENEKDVQIGGDVYPLMNGKPLDYIPFAIIGPDGIESTLDVPPLIDLVDANVAHYQINSDYRHGLHFAGLPTLFLSGISQDDDQTFHIGGSAAITSPMPDAKGMFIEFTGKGLGEIRTALDALKQEMALLGARAIADETKQAETLGATAIKRSGENSILSSIAMAISEAMEWALTIFAEWSGQKGEVIYQINRDFMPAQLSAQELTALVGAVQTGNLSKQEFFDLLQRHDVVDSEKTFDEHQEQIDAEPPPARPDPVVANEEDDEEEDAA